MLTGISELYETVECQLVFMFKGIAMLPSNLINVLKTDALPNIALFEATNVNIREIDVQAFQFKVLIARLTRPKTECIPLTVAAINEHIICST